MPDIDLYFLRDIREMLIRASRARRQDRSVLVAAFAATWSRGATRALGKALAPALGEVERVARLRGDVRSSGTGSRSVLCGGDRRAEGGVGCAGRRCPASRGMAIPTCTSSPKYPRGTANLDDVAAIDLRPRNFGGDGGDVYSSSGTRKSRV